MRGWLRLLIAIGALALGGLGVVAGIFLWRCPRTSTRSRRRRRRAPAPTR